MLHDQITKQQITAQNSPIIAHLKHKILFQKITVKKNLGRDYRIIKKQNIRPEKTF